MATAVRERPILFSAPMVRAILEDRKSVTRRVIVPQPKVLGYSTPEVNEAWQAGFIPVPCRYGHPGDRLWVRETWTCPRQLGGSFHREKVLYRADPMFDGMKVFDWSWKPSIHMPRWASRIQLEVTEVRVERLQEITTGEIWNEGVQIPVSERRSPLWRLTNPNPAGKLPHDYLPGAARAASSVADVARAHWADLWDTVNFARGYGWYANPWVWVVRFRRAA